MFASSSDPSTVRLLQAANSMSALLQSTETTTTTSTTTTTNKQGGNKPNNNNNNKTVADHGNGASRKRARQQRDIPSNDHHHHHHNRAKDSKIIKRIPQSSSTTTTPQAAQKPSKPPKQQTALQQKMLVKLQGSKFRMINEQLYTTTGHHALQTFSENPQLFDDYHVGFRSQVQQWSVNPNDLLIDSISTAVNQQGKQHPCHSPLIVADMGCGEAKLSQVLSERFDSSRLVVHSFDLVAANRFITVANIANVPLPDNSVDIVVFCLSLMGTDYVEFLREAKRILKPR